MSEYDVMLGPLAFTAPVEDVGETVGDGLEAVGASLAPGERSPQPLDLVLRIRASDDDEDPKEKGEYLRELVRSVMQNTARKKEGLFLYWSEDPQLDTWLRIGSGRIVEDARGLTFGEYALELKDVYVVGRPGTHRPGRRADIKALAAGQFPRDTRELFYVVKGVNTPQPAEPIYLPGDVSSLTKQGGRPAVGSGSATERAAGRHAWRSVQAVDGDVFSYQPDRLLLPERTRYQELDDFGSVQVWDLEPSKDTIKYPTLGYPPNRTKYTEAGDVDPTLYGWAPLYGSSLSSTHPLAMDNGLCRVIWLGYNVNAEGLAIEVYDETKGHYVRRMRVANTLNVIEQRVIESTTERAVLEWRNEQFCMRAVLQRGWDGPKIEVYADDGGMAQLEMRPIAGGPGIALGAGTKDGGPDGASAYLLEINDGSTEPDNNMWVAGFSDTAEAQSEATGVILGGNVVVWERPRGFVLTFSAVPYGAGPAAGSHQVATRRSVVDARPTAVLIGR